MNDSEVDAESPKEESTCSPKKEATSKEKPKEASPIKSAKIQDADSKEPAERTEDGQEKMVSIKMKGSEEDSTIDSKLPSPGDSVEEKDRERRERNPLYLCSLIVRYPRASFGKFPSIYIPFFVNMFSIPLLNEI